MESSSPEKKLREIEVNKYKIYLPVAVDSQFLQGSQMIHRIGRCICGSEPLIQFRFHVGVVHFHLEENKSSNITKIRINNNFREIN